MIQRKQSIWLLIAALLGAGVFVFDIYRYHTMENGADVLKHIQVGNHYPSLLIAIVMTVLPLITIFMYGNRKRQIRMTFAALLAFISFTTISLMRVRHPDFPPIPSTETYWIGAVLPSAAAIFLVMAMLAIRKDEKLVRSVDRLR